MARKIKVPPASQQSVDALESKVDALGDRMDKRMDSGFGELKGILVRFAADFDRRLAKTATIDMLSDVKATVDGHTAVLDHIAGEFKGLQDARVLLGDMYKGHEHRIRALESRQIPPAP